MVYDFFFDSAELLRLLIMVFLRNKLCHYGMLGRKLTNEIAGNALIPTVTYSTQKEFFHR